MALACPAICAPSGAHADEFSTLPPGDPIATQLALISPAPVSSAAPASLTRYEAALQTARVILDVQNRESGTTSRAQWRAIAALCGSLKNELRQLGVDVDAARALALKNLKTGESPKAPKGVPKSGPIKSGAARNPSFLAPELVSPTASGLTPSSSKSKREGALEVQLLPGVRVATGVQRVAAARGDDLDAASRFAPGADRSEGSSDTLASQTALSYDLSHYLTLRAANSRLDWTGAGTAGENPLLNAPLFAGARGASATGGGVDLKLGAGLKLSTEVERLRADNGALASRIGGGASLSAFRDRFSLQMSLSRLSPDARGSLSATAAQASASLDVTPRLSLNLKYQGLFAPTLSTSASRVAGGVSLSF